MKIPEDQAEEYLKEEDEKEKKKPHNTVLEVQSLKHTMKLDIKPEEKDG